MNKDSRMTIEDLAVLMEKRFAQQDQKFEAMFENFAGMVARSFEAQSLQIQEVLSELRDFKAEAHIRFVTHREFDQFKLRLKN